MFVQSARTTGRVDAKSGVEKKGLTHPHCSKRKWGPPNSATGGGNHAGVAGGIGPSAHKERDFQKTLSSAKEPTTSKGLSQQGAPPQARKFYWGGRGESSKSVGAIVGL